MHLFASHLGTFEVEHDAAGQPSLRPFRLDPDPSPVGMAYLDLARHPSRILSPMVRRSWLEAPTDPATRRGRECDGQGSVRGDDASMLGAFAVTLTVELRVK